MTSLPLTQYGCPTRRMKKVLKIITRNLPGSARPDALAAKARVAALIASRAEDGKIAVIEGGRDCDGVAYEGRVSIIPATYTAYQHHEWCVGECADGPFHLYLERPSVAQLVEYTARDLGLEALEDGHPHALRY